MKIDVEGPGEWFRKTFLEPALPSDQKVDGVKVVRNTVESDTVENPGQALDKPGGLVEAEDWNNPLEET